MPDNVRHRNNNHSDNHSDSINNDNILQSQQPPSQVQQQQQQQQQASSGQQKPRQSTLVGKAAAISTAHIKAAKKIRKKAIFCVDNVDKACTDSHIRSFVESLSIEVLTCFEVKSRQRRNENAESVHDRKAFRLCIHNDDRARLLNAGSWPDSVTVSEWYFKPRSSGADADQHRPATDAASSVRTGHEPHQSHSDNDTASVTAAAASSVAVPDRDATGLVMSDDETILQVISPLNNGDGNE